MSLVVGEPRCFTEVRALAHPQGTRTVKFLIVEGGGWGLRDLRPHQLDLKLAPDSARIAFECGKRWSVLARRFEAGDGALGRAHAGCDCVLGETGARASPNPHYSRRFLLQPPIRRYDKPDGGRARRSVSQHTVSRMPPSLSAPRARLAWHLSGFVTNPRE